MNHRYSGLRTVNRSQPPGLRARLAADNGQSMDFKRTLCYPTRGEAAAAAAAFWSRARGSGDSPTDLSLMDSEEPQGLRKTAE